MISIEQCRGARALLDWSAQNLADRAEIGVATVRRFEGGSVVAAASIEAMTVTLIAAGITFITDGQTSVGGGDGVRITQAAKA